MVGYPRLLQLAEMDDPGMVFGQETGTKGPDCAAVRHSSALSDPSKLA